MVKFLLGLLVLMFGVGFAFGSSMFTDAPPIDKDTRKIKGKRMWFTMWVCASVAPIMMVFIPLMVTSNTYPVWGYAWLTTVTFIVSKQREKCERLWLETPGTKRHIYIPICLLTTLFVWVCTSSLVENAMTYSLIILSVFGLNAVWMYGGRRLFYKMFGLKSKTKQSDEMIDGGDWSTIESMPIDTYEFEFIKKGSA